jgi:hypothetical protein
MYIKKNNLLGKLLGKLMDFAEHNAITNILAGIISIFWWILGIMVVLVCLWLFIWLVGIIKTPFPFHP